MSGLNARPGLLVYWLAGFPWDRRFKWWVSPPFEGGVSGSLSWSTHYYADTGRGGWLFLVLDAWYKTTMGTIPESSSHPPFATEAANGVRLLLFQPAAFPRVNMDLQPLAFGSCLLQQDLPAVPLFLSPCGGVTFRDEASFRPWIRFPKDLVHLQLFNGRSRFPSAALWLNLWKNVSGFIDFTEYRGPESVCSGFSSFDAQTRRSGWTRSCFS